MVGGSGAIGVGTGLAASRPHAYASTPGWRICLWGGWGIDRSPSKKDQSRSLRADDRGGKGTPFELYDDIGYYIIIHNIIVTDPRIGTWPPQHKTKHYFIIKS